MRGYMQLAQEQRYQIEALLKGSFGDRVGSPAYSVMGDRLAEVLARDWQFERAN